MRINLIENISYSPYDYPAEGVYYCRNQNQMAVVNNGVAEVVYMPYGFQDLVNKAESLGAFDNN